MHATRRPTVGMFAKRDSTNVDFRICTLILGATLRASICTRRPTCTIHVTAVTACALDECIEFVHRSVHGKIVDQNTNIECVERQVYHKRLLS